MTFHHVLVAAIFCFYSHKSVCEEVTIHRSACRRDTLFKRVDANHKLSGSGNVVLRTAPALSYCVRDCLQLQRCLSVNYKYTGGENNCELLDLGKSNSTAILSAAGGWHHYGPVLQV